ncbi:MAG: aminoacyl-tRNA hydrolase [Planctomycetota bacterium]|nr:MAG: aminoacyl-tRNA hydrolase [Planctomycetota bacterium]
MKLVVGLGNPGRRYEGTRHNVGFEVLRILAEKWGDGKPRKQFHGETVETRIAGEKVLLLSPTTYMNRSGTSVAACAGFYRLEPRDILVVCDDLDLPLGKLRLRPKGSPGGHKGLADIIRMLGRDDFPRLRVGIGRPPAGADAADYVLDRFASEQRPVIEQAFDRAAEAVVAWVECGIDVAMNRYNG